MQQRRQAASLGSQTRTRNGGHTLAPTAHRVTQSSTQIRAHLSEWSTWVDVKLIVAPIPQDTTVNIIYNNFQRFGNLDYVRLEDSGVRADENRAGGGLTENSYAVLTFRPLPVQAFWQLPDFKLDFPGGRRFPISLTLDIQGSQKVPFGVPNPIDPRARLPGTFDLRLDRLDFGFMSLPDQLMIMRKIEPKGFANIALQVNFAYRELTVQFPLQLSERAQTSLFRFTVPLRDLGTVLKNSNVMTVSLDDPPAYFRKAQNPTQHLEAQTKTWNERTSWLRQTDLTSDLKALMSKPVTLSRSSPFIDMGYWTTFRLHVDHRSKAHFHALKDALTLFNVTLASDEHVEIIHQQGRTIPTSIDDILEPNNSLSFSMNSPPKISDRMIYQLQACITAGVFHPYNISHEFLRVLELSCSAQERPMTDGIHYESKEDFLERTSEDDILAKLEFVSARGKRVYDPMDILDMDTLPSVLLQHLPHYCMVVRSVAITPTRVYVNSPTVETSNRITRQYREFGDRFLRVQ